jgi:ATP-binding cassette subfamily B multidrug efflux pump
MKHLWRIRHLIRPYLWQFSLALILLLGMTALNLVIPKVIQQIIDIGLVQQQYDYLFKAAMIIMGIAVLRAILPFGVRYLSEWMAAHVGYDLRNRMYNHIQYLPFTYHDHAQSGQLISRTIEDVRAIERFTGFSLTEIIRVGLLIVGITTILFTQNARLAATALLPLIPMVWITLSFGKRVGKMFLNVDNTQGELSSRLQENVTGAQVVRAFAREPFEIKRFDDTNRELYKAQVGVTNQFSKVMPTTNLLVIASTILILWFGGQMVLNGTLTLGELVAFNTYVMLLSGPTQQLTWLVNSAGEAIAGVQRTYEVLDISPAIASPENAVQLPVLSGRVQFNQVCFRYGGENVAALEDIDLEVEPNQVVALIGPTGSGKTSLVSLIPRFYDVAEGAVRIDGQDVREVDLVTLRRQIGIVLQTSLLFSTTMRENIAYGRPDASLDEVMAAAKAAQAHDFIMELSEGYETVVGERGVTLSGGQRQRVAIARALLLDPRILVLDDSTSSVDTQTERLIQQALEYLMEGRTTFVIAHRLSTVRRADLILVLDGGRIVERGTNRELLAANGLYRQIYELQLRDQEQFRDEMEALEVEEPVKELQTEEMD